MVNECELKELFLAIIDEIEYQNYDDNNGLKLRALVRKIFGGKFD